MVDPATIWSRLANLGSQLCVSEELGSKTAVPYSSSTGRVLSYQVNIKRKRKFTFIPFQSFTYFTLVFWIPPKSPFKMRLILSMPLKWSVKIQIMVRICFKNQWSSHKVATKCYKPRASQQRTPCRRMKTKAGKTPWWNLMRSITTVHPNSVIMANAITNSTIRPKRMYISTKWAMGNPTITTSSNQRATTSHLTH